MTSRARQIDGRDGAQAGAAAALFGLDLAEIGEIIDGCAAI